MSRPTEALLPQYATRSKSITPHQGLQCPPHLVAELSVNGLTPALDTLTNGSCCYSAFCISLMEISRNSISLQRSKAFKVLRTMDTVERQIRHLRTVAQSTMKVLRLSVMWEGMTYEQLALIMNPDVESWAALLEKVITENSWGLP